MSEEVKPDAVVVGGTGAANPLEQLTSLVLDAADAANESAQSTHESIAKLAHVVETHEQTTRAVRNAPAILGAIMLSVGVVMAIVVAIVAAKVTEKVSSLDVALAKQAVELGKVEHVLKELKLLESNLQSFKNIADETTQRAVVTLREQVKSDRLALQALEVRRLNEMLATLRGGIAAVPRSSTVHSDDLAAKIAALDKSLAGIDARLRMGRLEAMEDGIKRIDARLVASEKTAGSAGSAAGQAGSTRTNDTTAKDMKVALEQLASLKEEISAVRRLVELRGGENPAAGPAFRKPGGG